MALSGKTLCYIHLAEKWSEELKKMQENGEISGHGFEMCNNKKRAIKLRVRRVVNGELLEKLDGMEGDVVKSATRVHLAEKWSVEVKKMQENGESSGHGSERRNKNGVEREIKAAVITIIDNKKRAIKLRVKAVNGDIELLEKLDEKN